MGLSFLRVQRMTIWTFHGDVGVVKLLALSRNFVLFALVTKVLDTVMLFLLVIVGNFTVSTVDTSLCADL